MFASLRTRSSPVVIVIYSRYLHGLYMAGAWKCQFKEEEEVEEGNVGKDGFGMELGSVVTTALGECFMSGIITTGAV